MYINISYLIPDFVKYTKKETTNVRRRLVTINSVLKYRFKWNFKRVKLGIIQL